MPIQDGDTVLVHYVGRLVDGEEFDSSRNREPLRLTIGESMIPFEDALIGHKKGDRFRVEVPCEAAFGEHLDEFVFEISRDTIPHDVIPEVGMILEIALDDGDTEAVIVEVREKTVILDANHPLAGEDLVFDIEIVAVL